MTGVEGENKKISRLIRTVMKFLRK